MFVNSAMAQEKIAFVDSQKILQKYAAAADAQRKLDAENAEWDKELQELNENYKRLEKELENQSLLLSEAKKTEKTQELNAAAKEIQDFQNQKWGERGDYFKRRSEIMQPVIDQINQAIQRVAEEEEYDYVLDTVAGNILYAKDKFDLTDLVIEELEKETSSTQTQTRRRD